MCQLIKTKTNEIFFLLFCGKKRKIFNARLGLLKMIHSINQNNAI